MEKVKSVAGKVLYGLIFIVIIPLLLILWAVGTEGLINLPVPENPVSGYILSISGLIIMLSGMLQLMIHGKGLPMNAYPPEVFVRKGLYSLTKHPVYAGAVFISFGLSIIWHSSSGIWLVTPLFTLMTVAYVAGFENEKTLMRFGKPEFRTFLSLPQNDGKQPLLHERLSSFLLAFIPWIVVYEAFILAGVPRDAIYTNLSFEARLPVWEYAEPVYAFTYIFVLLIPFVIRTREALNKFVKEVWFAICLIGLIWFVIPFAVLQREIMPHNLLSRIILFERSTDGETGALPSFHVVWAFIAARYFAGSFKKSAWVWYTVASLISLSCIATGNHSIADVIAGILITPVFAYGKESWDLIRRGAEALANSWQEWRIGPLRIINHGFYGGSSGFAGMLITGWFLGPRYALAAFIVMIFVIIGAGLWAQIIEGSSRLLRPYGYYGGLIGGITGCALVSFIFPVSFALLLGSYAMAASWIQALGRLRCLVQGCCHGKQANENIGIRFTHPLSRVNKISGLAGTPLHPTQLYSIGCNIVSALILIRLYNIGLPALFIVGIYFILNGLGRFVEESLRGEAQTPYWAGMRIYQWIAIVNIAAGAILTTLPSHVFLSFRVNLISVLLAAVMGFIVMFVSGVDFPESDKRFARLTSN